VGPVSTCRRELLRGWRWPIGLMVSFKIFRASVSKILDTTLYCNVYPITAERVPSTVIMQLRITVASQSGTWVGCGKGRAVIGRCAAMNGFRVYWTAHVHTIPNKMKPKSETQCILQMEAEGKLLPAYMERRACPGCESSRFSRGLSRSLSS